MTGLDRAGALPEEARAQVADGAEARERPDADAGHRLLDRLLRRCERDHRVVGVVLSGSRACDGMPTEHSDTDVYLIVVGAAVSRWQSERTPGLDTTVLTVERFREPPEPWTRYSFTHARVLLDRLDGEIGRLVEAKGTLGRAEARTVIAEALDGYLNFAYRAAKNRRDGRPVEARLDAAESVPWLLTTVFGFYGRIRPYNRYLRWELERYPLGTARWDGLVPMMERVLDGDVDAQRYLFAAVENEARGRGFGDVLRAWGDDLQLLS